MNIKDGGPAFPSHGSMGEVTHEGMTLRDYFAAKAMQGLVAYMGCEAEATDHLGGPNSEVISRNSFLYADAMLAAREESK